MPDARDGQLLRVLFLTPSVRLMGARVSMLEFLRRVPRERYRAIVAVHAEGDLTRALQEAGIETRRILYRNYRKGKYFPLIPYAVSRLAALIRRERIDIVHSNEFWVNPYGVMAARLGGAASLCHFRTSRTPREIPTRKLRQYMVHRVSRVILVSPMQADHFEHLPQLRGRIKIIPNGVDLDRFRPLEGRSALRAELGWDGNPVIALLGTISPHKGHEDFLRAIPLIRKRHPEARFLVAGDPRPRQFLDRCHALARELGITERELRILPFHEDPVPVYQAMDILACPSRQEAFGRVNIEAMACGVPVVAYPVGGIPYVVRNGIGGILVERRDPEGLAAALLRLLDDPAAREELGRHGVEEVRRRFGIDKHVESILGVYEEILAERRGR
jgi:glycosyltransferase involved in cell wall biosynthesis